MEDSVDPQPTETMMAPTLEEQIAAKTGPKVSPQDIENAIAGEYFTTADKAFRDCPILPSLPLLTICVLVLRNGFTVVGTSACVSPENFEREIGEKVARADAIRQCWPLLGYALRDKVAAGA